MDTKNPKTARLRPYDVQTPKSKTAYLLGRYAGLYAYKTDSVADFDLSRFTVADERRRFIATIYHWIEGRPSLQEKRYVTALNIAVPFVKVDNFVSDPFDLNDCKKWYEHEIARQEARTELLNTLHNLTARIYDLCDALGIAPSALKKIVDMEYLPSLDIESCLNAGFNSLVDAGFVFLEPDEIPRGPENAAYFERSEITQARALFLAQWQEEYRRLLCMTPQERDREFAIIGV